MYIYIYMCVYIWYTKTVLKKSYEEIALQLIVCPETVYRTITTFTNVNAIQFFLQPQYTKYTRCCLQVVF